MSFLDILSVIGSLAIIVLMLVFTYYASRWYARRMGGNGSKHIKIVDRTPVGQGSNLLIAKVGDRYYMLGVGDKSVRLLTELDGFEEASAQELAADVPFQKVLRDLLNKAKKSPDKDDGGPE